MSKNFFAALDDEDDEPVVKAPVPKAPPKASQSQTDAAKDKRRPNNDRNTKSGRGGRTAPRDGKRAYDRRSGTGRGKEIKKGGGGARNWGSDKDEARKAEGTVVESEVQKGDRPARHVPKEDYAAEEVVEEVDNTISFEEFMKSKSRPKSDAFAAKEARSVGDEFASVAPAVAVEENFLVLGAGKAQRSRDKIKEKQTIQTGFRVAPSDFSGDRREDDNRGSGGRGRGEGRGGRGRGEGRGGRREGGRGGRGRGRGESKGGRGRGEGRGGRGEGRGGRGRSGGRGDAQLNTMDANAFPSL